MTQRLKHLIDTGHFTLLIIHNHVNRGKQYAIQSDED